METKTRAILLLALIALPGVKAAESAHSYFGHITGRSMLPVFSTHEFYCGRRIAYENLKPGMIVVRVDPLSTVHKHTAHFLVHKGFLGKGWVTRGCNNPGNDTYLMTPEDYICVVTWHTPEAR